MSGETHYYIYADEQQTGPYTFEQLHSMWQAGTINAHTLCCCEGKKGWHAYSDLLNRPSNVQRTSGLSLAFVVIGCAIAWYFYNSSADRVSLARNEVAKAQYEYDKLPHQEKTAFQIGAEGAEDQIAKIAEQYGDVNDSVIRAHQRHDLERENSAVVALLEKTKNELRQAEEKHEINQTISIGIVATGLLLGVFSRRFTNDVRPSESGWGLVVFSLALIVISSAVAWYFLDPDSLSKFIQNARSMVSGGSN